MKYTILIVPGLGDSGAEHWQSYWLNQIENSEKLIQNEWNKPQLQDWLIALESKIAAIDGNIIIVAHSLGTILVNHWTAKNYNKKVIGAMLVAPADVDSEMHTPEETWNFAPIPVAILPYASVVVTTDNDPYIAVEKAMDLAQKWGSDFVNVGTKGHLNTASNLKNWAEGQAILQKLINKISQ